MRVAQVAYPSYVKCSHELRSARNRPFVIVNEATLDLFMNRCPASECWRFVGFSLTQISNKRCVETMVDTSRICMWNALAYRNQQHRLQRLWQRCVHASNVPTRNVFQNRPFPDRSQPAANFHKYTLKCDRVYKRLRYGLP